MKGVLLLAVILFIPMVSAITFPTDTSFTEGNIKYVFKQGITFDNFEITSDGIIINEDERLNLAIQGGSLTVTFYDYNINQTIGLKSSVPQIITFEVLLGDKQYYLNDGNSYYLNSYNIDTEEVIFSYASFGDSSINSVSDNIKKADKLNWWEKKFTEIEISSEIGDDGIIKNRTMSISYMFLTISIFIFFVVIILWVTLRK